MERGGEMPKGVGDAAGLSRAAVPPTMPMSK